MKLSDLEGKAQEILQRYERPRAAMLPLLWLVQENQGYISQEAEAWVGRTLGVARSHVREAVSFYNMFHTKPVGRRELRVCTSLPCLLRGGADVLNRIKENLKISPGETTLGQEVTLTEVECLCACEMSPMAQLDETFIGPLEGETIDAILQASRGLQSARTEVRGLPEPFVSTDGPVLSKRFNDPDGTWFDQYVADDGYVAAKKALTSMTPEEVIDEVSAANLRGLGGAGFPAGRKWSFVPKKTDKPKYLVVNADEGEPGTFKDRYIMERDPHALLEGMIIAAYAIGSHKAYVYIRGEYFRSAKRLQRAVDEAYSQGWLGQNIQGTGFGLDVVIHRGAGAYICEMANTVVTGLTLYSRPVNVAASGELAVDERKTIGELSTPCVPLFRYSLIEPLPETDPALSHYSAETMQLIKESFPEYQILVLDSAQLLYKRLSAKASFSSDEQSLEYVKHTLSDGRQQDIGLNFISNQGMHGLFAKYITHDRHHNIRAILYQEEGKEGYQLDYLAEEIRKKYDGPMFNVFGWEKLSDADIYRKIIDAIKAQER